MPGPRNRRAGRGLSGVAASIPLLLLGTPVAALPQLFVLEGMQEVWGVSADGKIAAGQSLRSTQSTAALWTLAGGVQAIGPASSKARAVTPDGSAAVGEVGIPREAFLWTPQDGFVALGFGPEPTSSLSDAVSVSDDGQFVTGFITSTTFGNAGYVWTEATGMQLVTSLPGWPVVNAASAGNTALVSGDGGTVVARPENRPARWTPGGGFEFLSSESNGWPSALSSDGSLIAGAEPGGSFFRWSESTGLVDLGAVDGLPGLFGIGSVTASTVWVHGISDGGTLVGEGGVSFGVFGREDEAFLWDPVLGTRLLSDALVGEYGLDLQGWELDEATAISRDGNVIVGHGQKDGQDVAWMFVVPEPATALLVGLGLLVLAQRRR